MVSCKRGYTRSTRDKKRRCVKMINKLVCKRIRKEYNKVSRKCRIPCRKSQERVTRKDGRGTRCRQRCTKRQERGKRYCRVKCTSTQKRVRRSDKRGTRCVSRK